VQEYIAEAKGADLRALIVDGQVVGAMKRQSQEGEFRSNLHRGGSSVYVKLTEEELKLAIKAARALKLPVCGVDMLQSKRGPLIMEVNSTPGLEGIEGATGKNIARAIITFIERNRR
jgi:ribosomal protein S6--L-glutamate ligase